MILVSIAVVAAFRDLFGKFPTEWEWVGMVLAIGGLVMSTPPIVQLLGGRAKLELRFERAEQGADRGLVIYLQNPPVTNKILDKLGVSRDSIQSLTVSFRVSEAGSNTITIPIRQARIYSDDDADDSGRWRIALPPTFSVGASIEFAMWDHGRNTVVIPASRTQNETLIPEGYHRVDFLFQINGKNRSESRFFTVGQNPDDLVWSKS